jgi:hypothetical protein
MTIPLQHRANEAMAALDAAKTPMQKHDARQEGLAVKADLEKEIAAAAALAAFKAAQPQSSFGIWKGEPVADHPVFMVGPAGTKITAPVTLPDGSKATPNPQYQIVVPAHLVTAMLARGFIRANSVITPLGEKYPMGDPERPNNT